MDVYDIQSLADHNKYYLNESVLSYIMPNVYRLFLNVTIQHVYYRFNTGSELTFLEFEQDIDDIFGEINVYVPQFTTRKETPTNRGKRWIFGTTFTVVSSLVTAYIIYKSYIFKRNVLWTLHYILGNHFFFQNNILSNKKYLLSLAEIISNNFKDICSDISQLETDTNNEFDAYLNKVMHTTADSIFYENYVLHYVNILHHLDHDLVTHNDRIEHIKTSLHMKCRNFISGLHILAKNQIPESILYADVFFKHIMWCITAFAQGSSVYFTVWYFCKPILQYEHCQEFHFE